MAPLAAPRRAGRRVLLVAPRGWDAGPLPDLFPGEVLKITVAGTTGKALHLLATGAFDAVVLREPPCDGPSRSGMTEILRLAERLRLPAALSSPDRPLLFSVPEPAESAPADGSAGERASIDGTRLRAVMEQAIRPAFRSSGGDVELVRFARGKVVLRFTGVCAGCPASRIRHLEEIAGLLRAEVPGVGAVVAEPPRPNAARDRR